MAVNLSWANPNLTLVEDSVKIYRSTATMNPLSLPAALATLAAGSLDYEDTSAVDATTYYYRIAYMKGTAQYVSDEISVLAPTGSNAPTWLNVTNNSASEMAVVLSNGKIALGKLPTFVCVDWYSVRKLLMAKVILKYKSPVLTSESVTVTSADIATASGEFLSGFADGDIITWRAILDLMLVPSTSDIAATAERVLGGELLTRFRRGSSAREAFAVAMEEEATKAGAQRALCMAGSATITGENINQQLSASPADLCRIMAYAYKDTTIQTIMAQTSISINVTGPNPKTINRTTLDRNKLWQDASGNTITPNPISRYLGGKTGDVTTGVGHQVFTWTTYSGDKAYGVVRNASTRIRRQVMVNQAIMMGESVEPLLRNTETASDPEASNVALRIKGTAISDTSAAAKTVTNTGGATIVASDYMHGSAINFTAGQYLTVTEPMILSNANFTLEAYIQGAAGYDANPLTLFSQWKATTGARSFEWGMGSTGLIFWMSQDGTNSTSILLPFGPTYIMDNGGPIHICVQRSGNVFRQYVNGVPSVATTWANSFFSPGTASETLIGCRKSSVNAIERRFTGRIDELILTKNAVRYNWDGFIPYYRPNRWG